jgi:hypothetical protein
MQTFVFIILLIMTTYLIITTSMSDVHSNTPLSSPNLCYV